MSDKDREALETYADAMMECVRHNMAHLNGDDSECPRELVEGVGADGIRGQVCHALTMLTDEEREDVADTYGVDGWGELSAMLGEPQLDIDPWDGLDWDTLASAIESETGYLWVGDDLYLTPPCELLEDGEFHLGADDLSLDVLRDEDGDPAHIRVCWSLGGPSAFLIRDWDGDRLEVSWGFDSTVRRSREVRHLLDAYVEMLTY